MELTELESELIYLMRKIISILLLKALTKKTIYILKDLIFVVSSII